MPSPKPFYRNSAFYCWVLCVVFFAYEFLLRTVLGTFQAPIQADFHISTAQFALMSTSAYAAVYCLMQLPAGILSTRLGLKTTLIIATVTSSLSILGFSLSSHYYQAVACRMLTGFGSSFGFICVLLAIYQWLPKHRTAFVIGVSSFIGTLGPMLASGPLQTLSLQASLPWQAVFQRLAIIGIALALGMLFLVNNKKNVEAIATYPSKSMIPGIKKLLASRKTWFIALYTALVYFFIEYLSENEGSIYLNIIGYSRDSAAYFISFMWLSYAISCPVIGLISDSLGCRVFLMRLCALSIVAGIVLLVTAPVYTPVLAMSFALIGIGASGHVLGFAMMADHCDVHTLGLGLGFNSAMISVINTVNAPLIGAYLDRAHQNSAWHHELGLMIEMSVISLAIVFSLRLEPKSHS